MSWTCWHSRRGEVLGSCRAEDGQAIVEYAIVMPALLLLFMMGLQLVVIATSKIAMSNAVYDAARARATVTDVANKGELAAIRDLARRRATAAMSRTNLFNLDMSVTLATSSDHAAATANMDSELLPLVKQAVMAVGGSPTVHLRETAIVPLEPRVR